MKNLPTYEEFLNESKKSPRFVLNENDKPGDWTLAVMKKTDSDYYEDMAEEFEALRKLLKAKDDQIFVVGQDDEGEAGEKFEELDKKFKSTMSSSKLNSIGLAVMDYDEKLKVASIDDYGYVSYFYKGK